MNGTGEAGLWFGQKVNVVCVLFPFRRFFTIVPRDEVVEGLRANVSKLQHKLNRTQKWAESVRAKDERLKGQLASDRAYINELKEKLRVSYPATPVDCLLSELREFFGWDGSQTMSIDDFNARVEQFKQEIEP